MNFEKLLSDDSAKKMCSPKTNFASSIYFPLPPHLIYTWLFEFFLIGISFLKPFSELKSLKIVGMKWRKKKPARRNNRRRNRVQD